MATFLHRTTKQLLKSQSPNTLPEDISNYIEDPDLSAVAGQPSKYWVITGDVVSLADQSTRDAIDAALLAASRDGAVAQLDQVEDVLRAFMLVVIDEFNLLRAQHSLAARTTAQLRTAIRNKLGN